MMNATLLIELLTEELPPRALPALAARFAQSVTEELQKQQFVAAGTVPTVFATPRRLAMVLPDVRRVQPAQQVTRKGPSLAAGWQDGKASAALMGFARSCGVSIEELTVCDDGKQHGYVWHQMKEGLPLSAVLPESVRQALKALPVPKLMRWGDSDIQFVRPVHSLIMLHGDQIIAGEVLGLRSGNTTQGHRFLSQGPVVVADAERYARTLYEQGKVVASFVARREWIRKQLADAAAALSATLVADDALLDEVTALVEWPVVLEGRFSSDFLAVPQECLILTMQQNQKYFPLLDTHGRLMACFLMVSNLEAVDSSSIIQGNERVLRARLSDAQFFFQQDQKITLESRLPQLANVVYHNKLGSQWARIERLASIAGALAERLGADVTLAQRAARLAKADLVSLMVGEFPELQGTMGMHYARHDGEPEEVAQAIGQHYRPRFAGDALPDTRVATAVALADKVETLVGMWGIGLIPSGDKDPFALRRATLGILRMMLELPLDLKEVLTLTAACFAPNTLSQNVVDELLVFSRERLKHYLLSDFHHDEIDAVLALAPSQFDHTLAVLRAVAAFKALPEAAALASANKRVKNILKKAGSPASEACQITLLESEAERQLFDTLVRLEPQVAAQLAAQDFVGAFAQLASLREPVDRFFDEVMVMVEDNAVRTNRLALLARLAALLNCVADISWVTHTC